MIASASACCRAMTTRPLPLGSGVPATGGMVMMMVMVNPLVVAADARRLMSCREPLLETHESSVFAGQPGESISGKPAGSHALLFAAWVTGTKLESVTRGSVTFASAAQPQRREPPRARPSIAAAKDAESMRRLAAVPPATGTVYGTNSRAGGSGGADGDGDGLAPVDSDAVGLGVAVGVMLPLRLVLPEALAVALALVLLRALAEPLCDAAGDALTAALAELLTDAAGDELSAALMEPLCDGAGEALSTAVRVASGVAALVVVASGEAVSLGDGLAVAEALALTDEKPLGDAVSEGCGGALGVAVVHELGPAVAVTQDEGEWTPVELAEWLTLPIPDSDGLAEVHAVADTDAVSDDDALPDALLDALPVDDDD